MALKTCNLMLEANAQLQPSECRRLYDNMKHVVWIVKIGLKRKRENYRYSTGFCVRGDGYIITSAFRLRGASEISVRSLKHTGGNSFIRARKVGSADKDAGIALLKVDQKSDYAIIGDDTDLTVGRDVFGISQPGNLYFTFFIGKLISELMGKDEIDIEAIGLKNYIGELSADLQLLHISGFQSPCEALEVMQTLGAPVFNSRGGIIGMIVAVNRGYDYAVPASRLRQFFETVVGAMPNTAQSGEGSSGRISC